MDVLYFAATMFFAGVVFTWRLGRYMRTGD